MSAASAKKKTTKTVYNMILEAIRSQPQSANGVSRTAIQKYLSSELDYHDSARFKRALKQAVSSGKLVQTGQSFRVKGDPIEAPPPEETVKITTTKQGRGESAKAGDTVVVSYEGKLEDGTVFDSAKSFDFVLGAGDVIKGWDMGVVGMKTGEERKLEVPSKLGYGKRGSAPDIPPNADLFFTVTLKNIR